MTAPCTACGARVTPFLDMGAHALAGAFRRPEAPAPRARPLAAGFCATCFLVQILDPVPAAEVFADYYYFTSSNPAAKAYFAAYAADLMRAFRPGRVLEIGCNDGALALPLARLGAAVTGVDPCAAALARIGPEVATVNGYFDLRAGAALGPFDLVVANNVMAHVESVVETFDAVAAALAPDGAFVMEVHDLEALVRGMQYDDIYHEHRLYWSLLALENTLAVSGLAIADVVTGPMRGGSARYVIRPAPCPQEEAVRAKRVREIRLGLADARAFRDFADRAHAHAGRLRAAVAARRGRGRPVAGYGASGRANTLMQFARLPIDYVVDDAPEKWGTLMPGTDVPVAAPDRLRAEPPDCVVLFAWPYMDALRGRLGGLDLILPFPEIEYRRAREVAAA